ncbi:MAG: hypothetical protein ACO1NN_05590 [Sphingopyxis sp.]
MQSRLLAQAKSRLKLCERAFNEIKKCRFEQDDFQTHWQDFLVQWKGAYMKVQQAAKTTPQELQWFGGINTFRRKDPLLRWLYEARNDEEHYGLTDSAIYKPADWLFKLTKGGPRKVLCKLDGPNGPQLIDKETGEVVGVLQSHDPQVSQLQEVTERDGKRKVPPPTRHLGRNIPPEPKIAAFLGLQWLTELVASAEAMSTP